MQLCLLYCADMLHVLQCKNKEDSQGLDDPDENINEKKFA